MAAAPAATGSRPRCATWSRSPARNADIGVRGPAPEPGAGLIVVDPKPGAAFRDGDLLDLSRLEYDLPLFFAEHPRQVFTRGQLLVYGVGYRPADGAPVRLAA